MVKYAAVKKIKVDKTADVGVEIFEDSIEM